MMKVKIDTECSSIEKEKMRFDHITQMDKILGKKLTINSLASLMKNFKIHTLEQNLLKDTKKLLKIFQKILLVLNKDKRKVQNH